MDGEVSDLDLADDSDADPDFEPDEPIQRAQEEASSDDDSVITVTEPVNVAVQRRVSAGRVWFLAFVLPL